MSHNKTGKDYIHPPKQIIATSVPVTGLTGLQMKILYCVCQTRTTDYKSLGKATGRSRITVLQSVQSLIKHRLINKEKQNPFHPKSRRIFKPTDKGVFCMISNRYSLLNKIDGVHSLPNILRVYKEFVSVRVGWRSRSEEDWILIFVDTVNRYDLFDEKGECIIKDKTGLWNFFIKSILMEQLQKKYFDVENIFSEGGTWMNLVQDVGPIGGSDMIKILKKIRDDLDGFIEVLSG